MTIEADSQTTSRGRRFRGLLLLVMGGVAAIAPFFAGTLAPFLVGLLLTVCGVLEMLETFGAEDEANLRSAYLGGALSVVAGLLLLTKPQLIVRGLAWLLAGSFLVDGVGKVLAGVRNRGKNAPWKWSLADGLLNAGLAVVLATGWPVSGRAVVAFVVAVRMIAAGWPMLVGREDRNRRATGPQPEEQHPDRRLGLPAHLEFGKLRASLVAEEVGRRRIDAAWCWIFVIIFFAIHVGRMSVEWNLVGMISPLVAVLGDVATAILIAFGLVFPGRLAWRKLTRPLERRGWQRYLARIDQGRGPGVWGKLSRGWLVHRYRFSRRVAAIRRSPWAAMRWGLQVGLPLTAILIAVNPIWGFSWFFNSESWATSIWDHWAAQRTDTWRERMVLAVEDHYKQQGIAGDRVFQVSPEGVGGKEDFSFLVFGDTGEGGAAQHSLRDQFLFLGRRPDVKFLVISSDVIYPSGAMSDYESKFYLPFKGFTKPIFAIPGNHDWYDALEGFAANFFEADAARACMTARVEVDNRLTTTTEGRIEAFIREAARLRREFGVSTGWQRGPFFEIQTDRFALIAVDTGVLKRVDTDQWAWLAAALERAKGKFAMAILGHPLYAGGRYQGGREEPFAGEWVPGQEPPPALGGLSDSDVLPFAAVHRLLRQYRVPVVMAGDTHDFEYYQEPYEADGTTRVMHHFVNGGGGAYLSIGTPLDWPREPALADCAYFPRDDVLIEKLDRETPGWKRPLWWWTRDFRGWPLTAETLAGAFVYSHAPYLQSFVEVRVENSNSRVRLIPHGANGPLRWRDMQRFGRPMPTAATDDDSAEVVVPMPGRNP